MLANNNRGCPCLYVTPCQDSCSCVDPISSFGCQRCCRYGSLQQRTAMAEYLACRPQPSPVSGDVEGIRDALAECSTTDQEVALVLTLIEQAVRRERRACSRVHDDGMRWVEMKIHDRNYEGADLVARTWRRNFDAKVDHALSPDTEKSSGSDNS